MLFLADTNERMEPYYPRALFVVPAAGARRGWCCPTTIPIRSSSGLVAGRPHDHRQRQHGVHSELFLIDPAARSVRQLTDGDHFIPPSWAVVPSAGKIVLAVRRADEVWRGVDAGDRRSPGDGHSRHHSFDRLERDVALPRQQKVSWKSGDGTTSRGCCLPGWSTSAGRRFTTCVQMHGGRSSDKFGAGSALVQNYWAVLAAKAMRAEPNYRGSTGYGPAFYRDVVKRATSTQVFGHHDRRRSPRPAGHRRPDR